MGEEVVVAYGAAALLGPMIVQQSWKAKAKWKTPTMPRRARGSWPLGMLQEQPGGRDCRNAFEPEEKNHNYSTRCDAGYGVDSYPNDSSDANNDPIFASGHSDANSGSNEGGRRHMGNDVPTLAALVALNRANNQGAEAGSTLGHKIAWFGKRDV
ncbi:hypothetical protein VNO77_08411 [Canavalia gladiata]|uniref:Uncharacterized protein n=1 Tax=Canavalia gladiata TaxID=3824 RepID=A0AAN9QX15_CANGL